MLRVCVSMILTPASDLALDNAHLSPHVLGHQSNVLSHTAPLLKEPLCAVGDDPKLGLEGFQFASKLVPRTLR